ncbi:MAG: glycine cleavage system aminomethyltransferase GcvT [Propylenella sp.]
MTAPDDTLNRTPLHALHVELGARMVPFAGYSMPLQYEGILAEHRWTRERAGLFDVSHMGQATLTTAEAKNGGDAAHETAAEAIETLIPGDIRSLKKGEMRYSVLLNDQGGIIDDLIVRRPVRDDHQGQLFLVVNAGTKANDVLIIADRLRGLANIQLTENRALLALQGPEAASVLGGTLAGELPPTFMTMRLIKWENGGVVVTRSGYTGEDGFEIAVAVRHLEEFSRRLLAHPDVKPIGLGARDSLRLEAGLPLYGHDLDETTSPIEAGLAFVIGKRRRLEGGFPGADRIMRELKESPVRRRVGIRPAGRAPVREGAAIIGPDGATIGALTSGGFGPTVNAPIAMGYIASAYAKPGTAVQVSGRRGPEPAEVVALPFVPHRYVR